MYSTTTSTTAAAGGEALFCRYLEGGSKRRLDHDTTRRTPMRRCMYERLYVCFPMCKYRHCPLSLFTYLTLSSCSGESQFRTYIYPNPNANLERHAKERKVWLVKQARKFDSTRSQLNLNLQSLLLSLSVGQARPPARLSPISTTRNSKACVSHAQLLSKLSTRPPSHPITSHHIPHNQHPSHY